MQVTNFMTTFYLKSPKEPVHLVTVCPCQSHLEYSVRSTGWAGAELKCSASLFLPVQESSSVEVLSSESRQHGNSQWWEMFTASCFPPHAVSLTSKTFHSSMLLSRIYIRLSKWHMRHICVCVHDCIWSFCVKVLWWVTNGSEDDMRSE